MSTPYEPEHEKLRTDLGAYVLGALPADEVAVLEAHLATCAGCRAERDALLPAATVLGELKRDDVGVAVPVETAPDGLEALVLAGVDRAEARERRTAWARRAALAAVAGAAAAVVLVVGLAVTGDDPAPEVAAPPMEQVDVSVADSAVTADAALVNHTWGVEVKLTATGFDAGGRYQVKIVGNDGRRYPAGAFVGVGAKEMHCNLSSAVLRPDASGFEIRDGQGDVVVSSTFA